ncbi:MAG: hypothetical protein ACFFDN_50835 [Candidatus Hodarchaeota archaeon]
MEEQTNIGQLEVGTIEEEREKLEPKKVKIVSWSKKPVEKAHGDKIEFEVKHPDKEESIKISGVSFLSNKKVITVGTWFNLDKENKIQKNSALAILLSRFEVKNLDETKEKEIDTEKDESGFLVFKAY